MSLLDSLVALANPATRKRRVFDQFRMRDEEIEAIGREVATIRTAAYDARLKELARAFGLDASPSLTDARTLRRIARESEQVARGVAATHDDDLRRLLDRLPRAASQREQANRVRQWEVERGPVKAREIARTEGMRGRTEADRDVMRRNRIETRARWSPRRAGEPKCAAEVAKGWRPESEVDPRPPLHPNCVHGLEYDQDLADAAAGRASLWLGETVKVTR